MCRTGCRRWRRARERARWCSRRAARGMTSSRRTPRRSAASAPRARNEESKRLGITFHIGRSHEVLPDLAVRDLDLVLVDGAHGFPYPDPRLVASRPAPRDGRPHAARRRVPPGRRRDRGLRSSERRVGARGAGQLPDGAASASSATGIRRRGGCPGGARTHELRVPAAGSPRCRIRADARLLDADPGSGPCASCADRASPRRMETITITGRTALQRGAAGRRRRSAPRAGSSSARARIEASNAVIEAALAGREPIYGLTTQVGHGKDELLTEEQLGQQQRMARDDALGRAGRTAADQGRARRAHGPSQRHRARWLRREPRRGGGPGRDGERRRAPAGAGDGVGRSRRHRCSWPAWPRSRSGSAAPSTGRGALGRRGARPGRDRAARARGEGRTGPDLRERRLDRPRGARCRPRDTGRGDRRRRRPQLSMEATGSNLSILEPAVAEAKPFPGQIAAASHLRERSLGELSARTRTPRARCRTRCRFESSRRCTVRCASSSRSATEPVEIELNSASDNPLVSVDGAHRSSRTATSSRWCSRSRSTPCAWPLRMSVS